MRLTVRALPARSLASGCLVTCLVLAALRPPLPLLRHLCLPLAANMIKELLVAAMTIEE